ncbi:MAG: hypothetical protein JXB88_25810 [Spirochaetales bacterium]|nr:hypothetical protein [Spirochaetales bacterium]
MFLHPDRFFLEFIKEFLKFKGFDIIPSHDCVTGFSLAVKILPDLIILNKNFPHLDGKGFLTKKRTSSVISFIPVFVIGDFSTEELVEYKRENVSVFLSSPVDPNALAERLYLFFNIVPPPPNKHTPMLLDIHSRGKIIIIQIEGNLDPGKTELLVYLVRAYCRDRKIKSPRLFIIIPSLYPENITKDNIDRLFKFTTCPELDIKPHNIKILTTQKEVISILKRSAEYTKFEIVKNFFEGIKTLMIDFDKAKTIPAEFLKLGTSYIFDLFDKNGKRIIPALSIVNEEVLETLRKENISSLTYYSDDTIREIDLDLEEIESIPELKELYDVLLVEYESIGSETQSVKIWDEKYTLFFQSTLGKKVLIVTKDESLNQLIMNTLEAYLEIHIERDGQNIDTLFVEQDFCIAFIDAQLTNPSTLDILGIIRKHATRRKTSVIIMAEKIDKASVVRFRDSGTNNIIVSPFSTNKIMQKVFESVTLDRRK